MTSQELIDKYLEFFRQRGHTVIPPASLIPENDPTVLFTTAGMHPLVPYLLGQPHAGGNRLANVQPCIRTNDIEAVGDVTHLTFFEMLGNWSLGDYFKGEAIKWSWEFLTGRDWLDIPPQRLSVSVFDGDAQAPRDDESAGIWRGLGVPSDRIAYLGTNDNWWGPAGLTGPCGPDTEMFYWTGDQPAPRSFDPRDTRWVEIWNDVFMQYQKTDRGDFAPLRQKNVDTGMGVERAVAVLNGGSSVYDADTFTAAISALEGLAPRPAVRPIRVIADHLRAASIILADPAGVVPSNTERGYVLRRLIRRAVRFGLQIGIENPFTADIAGSFVQLYQGRYPWIGMSAPRVREQLEQEEVYFRGQLAVGSQRLLRRLKKYSPDKVLPGSDAFDLFQSYGFPLEITEDISREQGWSVDRAGFHVALAKHQELSRTATAGRFRSGLADTSVASTQLHTATHLLHAALRQVLGEHVQQKGSNITPQRLRFDFSHPAKLTPEEIKQVEGLVNQQIRRRISVVRQEMTAGEAKRKGALGFFGHKYVGRISVYRIGDFSQEICTGPHVGNTAELGRFRILKEEACSAGIRRIKAVVEHADQSP